MKIRRATVSDIPALIALNRIVHAMHSTAYPAIFRPDPPDKVVAEAFRSSIETPSSYWLLAEEEQVLAFLNADFCRRAETWCINEHQVCYLGGIVVLPGFRRKGIAKALLVELKRTANSRGISRIELDVWSFNDEARQAFASLGFRPVREKMALFTSEPN